MKFLDRIDKVVSEFAVKDLMKYIMLGSLLVYLVDLTTKGMLTNLLYFNRDLIMRGQIWRAITFIFVPGTGSLLILITFFFYYFIGRTLEMAWGTVRFNTYYFMGLLFTIIGGFVLGYTTTYYLNMTLFLAYATTFPDSYVNIYFVLPIKVKFLGYLYGAMVLFEFIGTNWTNRFIIIISLLNFLLFFGPSYLRDRKRRNSTAKMRRNIQQAKIETKITSLHKCTTCGITERDDPKMEFRYCSKCEGNYEYCEKHIRNHMHKSKVINMDDRRM